MADFNLAIAALWEREGVYSNDPDDAGGETYRGISRRYWQQWSGWALIDAAGVAGHERVLDGLASQHYRTHLWNLIRGDDLHNEIGRPLFLAAVLTNPARATEWLQRALNAMNLRGERYADLEVDGTLGPKTLDAIAGALASGVLRDVMAAFRAIQTIYYVERIEQRPTNEKYARGWIRRANEV